MNNEKIIDYLKEKGFRPSLSGFRYAYECIAYCLNKPTVPLITVDVYPAVAKKLATSPSKVERAIRHCLDTIPKHLTGWSTNKDFIAGAVLDLKLRTSKK